MSIYIFLTLYVKWKMFSEIGAAEVVSRVGSAAPYALYLAGDGGNIVV
jgi:hypothetical protein